MHSSITEVLMPSFVSDVENELAKRLDARPRIVVSPDRKRVIYRGILSTAICELYGHSGRGLRLKVLSKKILSPP